MAKLKSGPAPSCLPLRVINRDFKRGFSLLELLIALFLLLVILGGSLLLLQTANRSWFRGESEVAIQTEARNLIAFLNRIIPGAVLTDSGDEERLEFSGYPDRISFCALLSEDRKKTDFARIDIFWKEKEGTVYVFEERAGNGRRIFSGSGKTGSQPLSGGVTKFKFSYFDGKECRLTWNSSKDGPEEDSLPKAVFLDFQLSGQKSDEGRIFCRDYHAVFEIKNN
ncbi:MAG: prepilin-type N-terminal cleavage/methylation domain-containing protein [Candidatus Omnitrophica bacterium]|nr:prepilin-type N-terminal cleavage/methylation domain-containing protein [Candidatus Omnitrophota bacterium]